jgi:hypothetical protein
MKLKTLTIKYNAQNYSDWDGTPANSYSGKIELDTKIGTVTTILTEEDVGAIVNVIASRVADDMVILSQTVAQDIRLSVERKAIEQEV